MKKMFCAGIGKKMSAFRDFILDEMKKRDMSARQFALLVGVDPTTVTRAIDSTKPALPGLDFIISLSKATRVSAGSILELAYPEVLQEAAASPSSQVLAQQIERLPDNLRETVIAIIRGAQG